jgi:hypothetical protein
MLIAAPFQSRVRPPSNHPLNLASGTTAQIRGDERSFLT